MRRRMPRQADCPRGPRSAKFFSVHSSVCSLYSIRWTALVIGMVKPVGGPFESLLWQAT